MDALSLGDNIGKRGEWSLFYGRETVCLPIEITNARINHGNMEFKVKYTEGRSDIWVPASAVRVNWDGQTYEQVSTDNRHEGLCEMHWSEALAYLTPGQCIACEIEEKRY